ncbi:hypothetical protein BN946_scf184911.g3 [Trametes cinnabarina]|uniref:amidase n=1 Tax=Pycnoporus cinnabarinus TaxID=5643 RepID=A0A060SGI1_PYCCI|nr:hypothetical protein BN946_scf184911.g3 [Trametes cinnabarina]
MTSQAATIAQWQEAVADKRKRLQQLIPHDWTIPPIQEDQDNVLNVPKASGLLTDRELEITDTSDVSILLKKLASAEWSAVEVTTAFSKRAIIAQQAVNCLTEIFLDRALRRAAELDAYMKEHGTTVGPLHGLPVSLKDQFPVKGLETVMGYAAWIGHAAEEDAVLVQLLLRAGAVLFVRTNVPQTLMWGETYNNVFGRTLNPYNRKLTPGGSSGGESALIAMHGSPLGVGSDIGGSIRVPSHFCGLYGFKPSSHRIPTYGNLNSLDGQDSIPTAIGPLTTSLSGVTAFLRGILDMEPWRYCPETVPKPWSQDDYSLKSRGGGEQLCFGIMWDEGSVKPQPPILRALRMTKAALEAAGHKVSAIEWKSFQHAEYVAIARSTWLADGGEDYNSCLITGEPLINSMAPDALPDDVPAFRVTRKPLTAFEQWQLNKERRALRKAHLDRWESTVSETGTGRPIDALICPVAPYPAVPHGRTRSSIYTIIWNTLDYPALVIPVTKVIPEVDAKPARETFWSEDDRAVHELYNPTALSGLPVAIQLLDNKSKQSVCGIKNLNGRFLQWLLLSFGLGYGSAHLVAGLSLAFGRFFLQALYTMSDIKPAPATTAHEERALPSPLENLSKLIAEQPEALAIGSEDIRRTTLEATKYVFDLALQTEEKSRLIVNDLLTSISPDQAPQTRSQKRKRGAGPSPEPENAVFMMKETPINQLFVEGMSDEQIWAQLELRTQNICNVLDYALDGPTETSDSGDEDEERQLKKMRQALIDEGFDPEELEGMEFGEDGEEDEDEASDDEDEGDDDDESEEEDDDDLDDVELGEDVQELRDPSDEEDEDEEPEIGEPSFLNGGKRTIKLKPPKRGGHPVLDDGFFDLAAFNAEIEAAESKSVSRGKLSKDDDDEEEDEEEDVDYFAPVDEQVAAAQEDLEDVGGELHYEDFFDPPSRAKVPKARKETKSADEPKPSKGKVRFHEEVRVKKIKAKGKNLPVSTMFYEEEEDDGEEFDEEEEGLQEDHMDESEDGLGLDGEGDEMLSPSSEEEAEDDESGDEDESMNGDEENEGYETIERLKDDLFADDEEEKPQESLSTYEKRMAALREEIAALEAENVGQKDWTLMGEATSRSRPQNSLLEEDLEFERVMKSVPVITEEVVHSLEERIKSRILDHQFDDVVRKRLVDDKPFLPSRFFELQDTKSKQSLAEIYEDEYSAAQSGRIAGEDRDGKLKKEHEEIEKMWDNICSKLDALSNAHFTPKAPKATITTVSNVAAATLESALPTTKATTTMLAPEEVYAPSSSNLRARSELTPAEKRALRNKQKKANKKVREAIQKAAEKIGRPRGVGDVKRQKEAALKTLVKSGKGVTVVGKKSKEVEGRRGKSKG